jgi:hypothetical protein
MRKKANMTWLVLIGKGRVNWGRVKAMSWQKEEVCANKPNSREYGFDRKQFLCLKSLK